MNWVTRIEELEHGRVRRVIVLGDGEALSYGEAVEGWRGDEDFRSFFVTLLADAPYDAYFWETPPVTKATLARQFEFIIADSPALAAMRPDTTAFSEHFMRDGAAGIAAFWNLGRDALLIAPGPPLAYPQLAHPHLAAFARSAPMALQHAFWRTIGERLSEQLSDRPSWLSTCGLGIAWLHVRIDTRPKYYTHRPYRDLAG